MTNDGWVRLIETGDRFSADILIAQLDAEDIPTLVKGPESGIYGPGMAGATPLGVTIFVPASALQRARELLEPLP